MFCCVSTIALSFRTYFNPKAGFKPTGSGLCQPAFIGLSVFFKPLALPITYCMLVASDTSGRMLLHTHMTETLCFAVQVLALVWLVCIGLLSCPLLFIAFPFFGIIFAALYLYYVRIFLPRYWSDQSGLTAYRGDKEVVLSQWDVLKRFRSGKEEGLRDWYRLDNEVQDKLLNAESLGTILLLRTAPFALCFGISLWRFYLSMDYVGELQKIETLIKGVIPLIDFHALIDMIRWPKDLALPEQIPLAVSVGAIVIENLPKLWRKYGNAIAGTTASALATFTRPSKSAKGSPRAMLRPSKKVVL